MGWSNGCYLATTIWNSIVDDIPSSRRRTHAKRIYDLFCDEDADSWEGNSRLEVDAGEDFE